MQLRDQRRSTLDSPLMGEMKTRYQWMDLARGVAILLVIGLHAMTQLPKFDIEVPAALVIADDAVSPFRMPLLMFLSGMLLTRSLSKRASVYFGGKVRTIIWPYVLWSLILLAATGALTLSAIVSVVLVPPTYLWYLWFLFAYYVLAWPMSKMPVPPIAWAAVALAASAVAPDTFRISRFLYLLAFFMLGWWWNQQLAKRWSQPSPAVRTVIVALASAAAVAGSAMSALGVIDVRYEAVHAWIPLALLAAVALGLPALRLNGALSAPFRYVGRNSVVFYVTHVTAIWLLDAALVAAGVQAPWALYIAGVVVALIVGFAFSAVRQVWAPAGWLFELPRVPARSGDVDHDLERDRNTRRSVHGDADVVLRDGVDPPSFGRPQA